MPFVAIIQILFGLTAFAAGLVALVSDVPVANILWYLPGWIGYLLVLDAVTDLLGEGSWLRERRAELISMAFWSVPFWYLFELYNLRIENWYYVYSLRGDSAAFLFSWLAFGTVLPAFHLHARLLRATGIFEKMRSRPFAVGRSLEIVFVVAGVVCLVLPLAFPRQAFWMVWGIPFFLPEIAVRRAKAPSILRDLEQGKPARLARFLAGGLLAGLAWESMNYWARCKWIYTVPGFEEGKLFEMPYAGFLGFPVLALGAFSFWAIHRWAYHDAPRTTKGALIFAGVAFTVVAFVAVDHLTVRSDRPLLEELDGLQGDDVAGLAGCGLSTPERVVRAVAYLSGEEVAEACDVDLERLLVGHAHARLALHKGMGAEAARWLIESGVSTPADLVGRDPAELAQRLEPLAEGSDLGPPSRAEVAVWVAAARIDGAPVR